MSHSNQLEMGDKGIEENPFAALFPSLGQAEQFVGTQKELSNDSPTNQVIASDPTETEAVKESKDVLGQTNEVNRLLERIFLITLDKDCQEDPDPPPPCVYLGELSEALHSQTWIDTDCLQHAVFERLMLDDADECVVTSTKTAPDMTSVNRAAEHEALRYLFCCFRRWLDVTTQCEDTRLASVLTMCKDVIITNARTCFQQPDLFLPPNIHQQFMAIYHEECQFSADLTDAAEQFFTGVIREIEENEEDGSLLDVFSPVLTELQKRFTDELSLMHADTLKCLNLVSYFSKTQGLAQVFMTCNTPGSSSNGRAYENTLLGSILSLSCIPKSETGPYDFFNNPSSYTRQEHDITESNLWQPLGLIGERVHQLFMSIIRLGPDFRHQVLSWLGMCIHANSGRTKIWSNQLPQLFNQMYCSEGFSLNLCSVMLRLCQPFAEPRSPKLLKIQASYTAALAASDEEAKTRGLHAHGLNLETMLVPCPESNPPPAPDGHYSFITECFFLCEQALNLGFHTVHDKIVKLNQDLHRVQRLYTEVRGQAVSDEVEPVRSIKMQMDKGMTLFLSMKAALTEPRLMEMSLTFHLATATWLTQVATHSDLTTFHPIRFPLPDEVPDTVCHIPEFIMGNLTDFVLFCHRFKDDMFERAGDRVEHLMTLILVFMGSPHRMKNPHLRAEFADMLSALMPPPTTSTGPSGGLLSRFDRERLFVTHPSVQCLAETLLHVFVSIEMTGQSVEFEQKFNYRRPMYIVLEYIWEIEIHKKAIMRLASEAEHTMEATDPPLFLRFINLLINDAIFLLDEALSYMSQIKEKQQEKDGGDWAALDERQRQDAETNLRHLGMLARYHNVMGNHTIHAIELITTAVQSIFCHNTMVDRIASMLNYFLLHLVGPKQKNFSVKDKNEYEFKPQQIVLDIVKIYLNLGHTDNFCLAVMHDGRSYSTDLFNKAVQVLSKISNSPQITSDFLTLDEKIRTIAEQRKEEDDLLADAPEEFLDPLLGTLMRDPVLLPTSKKVIDRSVIARHILSDQSDPFNRQPLNMEMVIPDTQLKHKIDSWVTETKKKLRSPTSS